MHFLAHHNNGTLFADLKNDFVFRRILNDIPATFRATPVTVDEALAGNGDGLVT